MSTGRLSRIYARRVKYSEKIMKGECVCCTEFADEDSKYCKKHIEKNKEKYKRAKKVRMKVMWKR